MINRVWNTWHKIVWQKCTSLVPHVPAVLLSVAAVTASNVHAQEWKSGVDWQEPPVVTPGAENREAPSDAIILFDGVSLSQWEDGDQWIVADGVAIPQGGEIVSKQAFGDIQLHIEWSAPTEIKGESQGRGNSGIFFMEQYEVQVLDSYQNETYFDGQAASIYKQTPPLANAMRRPGEWNTYDIIFTAPSFRVNGELETPAYITVLHNGVVALNHFEILGSTGYTAAPSYTPHAEKAPLSLQFHNDPVRFRNIWVRELKPAVGTRVSAPFNIVKEPKPTKQEVKKDRDADKSADAQTPDEKATDRPVRKSDNEEPVKVETKADKKKGADREKTDAAPEAANEAVKETRKPEADQIPKL